MANVNVSSPLPLPLRIRLLQVVEKVRQAVKATHLVQKAISTCCYVLIRPASSLALSSPSLDLSPPFPSLFSARLVLVRGIYRHWCRVRG